MSPACHEMGDWRSGVDVQYCAPLCGNPTRPSETTRHQGYVTPHLQGLDGSPGARYYDFKYNLGVKLLIALVLSREHPETRTFYPSIIEIHQLPGGSDVSCPTPISFPVPSSQPPHRLPRAATDSSVLPDSTQGGDCSATG